MSEAKNIGDVMKGINVHSASHEKTAGDGIVYDAKVLFDYAVKRGHEILAKMGKKFILDKHNTKVFDEMAKYFAGDKRFNGSLYKGVLLRGNVGVGKTFVFNCFSGIPNERQIDSRNIIPAVNVVMNYEMYGSSTMEKFTSGRIVIDELNDIHTGSYYGNKMNVMQYILEMRYNLFIRSGIVMHITTNFKTGDEIEEHFGLRVRSRFKEMFNVIDVTGDDRRN